ncbi:hypothetical protein JXA32_16445 [Candidatus Sumerlaeota bacterium]|nr:hypothetical protein [Candidatus Sumerlaeota bacterium]
MKAVTDTDRRLAIAALEKQKRGVEPTARESAALNRIEKEREKERRKEYYKTVSKTDYREMSGRPAWVLNKQADHHGIPLRGEVIDLYEVVKWFHDFLAENKWKLRQDDKKDPEELNPLERERLRKLQIENDTKERNLIPRDEIHELMVRLAAKLRNAGTALQRQYGPKAQVILDQALDEFDEEVEAGLVKKDT